MALATDPQPDPASVEAPSDALVAALRASLAAVRVRIAAACARADRDPASVRLVAVSKTLSLVETRALILAGAEELGENRIPQLPDKQVALGAAFPTVRWHMIGHLQRNKVLRFLDALALLHSVDSARLVDVLERRLPEHHGASPLDVLLEVNVAGEAHKHGIAPQGLDALLSHVDAARHVRAVGLMAMAPAGASADEVRDVFRALREQRDRCRERSPALSELSMGMSDDFEVACEEGATLVRVGRAITQATRGGA